MTRKQKGYGLMMDSEKDLRKHWVREKRKAKERHWVRHYLREIN